MITTNSDIFFVFSNKQKCDMIKKTRNFSNLFICFRERVLCTLPLVFKYIRDYNLSLLNNKNYFIFEGV